MGRTLVRLSAVLTFALASRASAQSGGTPLELGRSYRLESHALGETRIIDVSLPQGYDADTSQRYPVLVVLDGEFEHEIAVAATRFYATMGQLPATIVVGVRNVDRSRDMTPTPVPGFTAPREAAHAGGAERFLSFIATELVPYLDRHYRTAPMRVLVGHSLGGLFAVYALDQRPDLFTGYLVMEPAVWWNNQKEFAEARVVLQRPAAARVRLMLVNTQSLGLDTTSWGGTRPMVRHLATTGETHASMALSGMMQGLRLMFADFRRTEWQPGKHPIQMLDRFDSLRARIGYAPPIPAESFSTVVRMSIDSRYFDDAQVVLDRWDRVYGPSAESREFRDQLRRDRANPPPAGFVQLEIPARRPTPQDARAFLGRWVTTAESNRHEVEILAAGDTIAVRDRVQMPDGSWIETDGPVIQVTADGTLEWGLPYFRGLAALVVLMGRVQGDGTMTVRREPRGWVPQQSGPEMTRTERFRRIRG